MPSLLKAFLSISFNKLPWLDSRILDETSTTNNLDDSKMIVEELKRNIEECASSSSQPNSLDVSFDLDSSKVWIL